MNLDDDEIELVLRALRQFAAVSPCQHCAGQCRQLIEYMELFQQDQKEEKADA
jgi:hypothetical protein